MSEEWSRCKDSFGVGVGQHQGSTLSADGKKEKETSGRTQERWKSCWDVSGVLCDKKYLKLKREKYVCYKTSIDACGRSNTREEIRREEDGSGRSEDVTIDVWNDKVRQDQ